MITRRLAEEIHALLQTGELSQRQIARRLNVSRGTVHNIASGKRGTYGHEPGESSGGPAEELFQLPPARCRKCGCLVYPPCVACRAQSYWRRERSTSRGTAAA